MPVTTFRITPPTQAVVKACTNSTDIVECGIRADSSSILLNSGESAEIIMIETYKDTKEKAPVKGQGSGISCSINEDDGNKREHTENNERHNK